MGASLMAIDRAAAERAVEALLRAIGHDPRGDPELADTPARVVEAFANDLLSGEDVDVRALLEAGRAASKASAGGLVVVRDIAVATMCPHHLLPALGAATVAYLPGRRLFGLGTIARLVDVLARRLTLQEQIGQNVVQALTEHGGARGAYCRLALVHSCLSARGARQSAASVHTIAASGELAGPDAAAMLALALGGSSSP
jgi:GTP cyclohydrolase IA